METYSRQIFAQNGIALEFVQHNHSHSIRRTLRGLHYQVGKPQAKLVRVLQGAVYDVAVDIRQGSPNYGKWVAVELSSENRCQLYVPVGFAHGFCVISEKADVTYACGDYYHPEGERGIIWNDPDLNIAWPTNEPILSDKDQKNILFRNLTPDFVYQKGKL